MYNSLRVHQYINDFMRLIDIFYKYEYRVILSNYYLFDWKNSVYDKEVLQYGAYERIGDLTGYNWIKINYFPVAFTQQAIPRMQTSKYGVSKQTETQSVFPRINFTPTALDFITFHLHNHEVDAIYQISNYEISYIGNETPIYRVTLKEQFFDISDLSNQISEEYCYLEISDKIYTPEIYNHIISAVANLHDVMSYIQEHKEMSSGLTILKE